MSLRTLAAAALLAPAVAAAPASAAGPDEVPALEVPVKEGTLSNGMRVLVVERHEAPTVSCVITFRVGGVDEHVGETGIAHILEHMLFKGTDAWGTKDYAAEKPLPALYAMTHPGVEPVAADEITRDLGGEVKKTSRGLVVFRVDQVTPDLLNLRTTEDVFLLAWGSDSLTFKPEDLKTIQTWTARKPDWDRLFKLHHSLRPKTKGKPTYNLVCQMQGEHGYRRSDASPCSMSVRSTASETGISARSRTRYAIRLPSVREVSCSAHSCG